MGAKSKEEIRNAQMEEADDIKEVMSTAAGRRFVYKLIERSGLYRCSSTGQTNTTFFNEGGRNQGLMLLSDVSQYAPASYQQMIKENNNG